MGDGAPEGFFPVAVLVIGLAFLIVGGVTRRKAAVWSGAVILALLALIALSVVVREVTRPSATTIPYPGSTTRPVSSSSLL